MTKPMAVPTEGSELSHLGLLARAIELIGGPYEPTEILPRVLPLIASCLPCDRLAAFEFQNPPGAYCLSAHHGLTPLSLAVLQGQRFPPGQPFGGLVRAGQVIVANNVAAQQWLSQEFCRMADIAAYVATPLQARGTHHGALVVARASPSPFSDEEVRVLSVLGRQLGLGLEMKTLLLQQREYTRRVEALSRFSRVVLADPTAEGLRRLCELVTASAGCDVHQLWMWDSERERFVLTATHGEREDEAEVLHTLGINPPFARSWYEHLTNKQAVVFPENPLPPVLLSLLPGGSNDAGRCVFPLRQGQTVTGFSYSSFRQPTYFRAAQLELLARAAQIASLAIEHLRAAQALTRAARLRSEFVATISHELRTPLNVLLGYCDLLLSDTFGPLTEPQRDTVRRMELRSRELADLVSNTLDFNRIESAQLSVQPAAIRITDLLEPLLYELRYLHDPDQVMLTARVTPPDLEIVTDPSKLRVILKNLLSNALKFTRAGEVQVRAQRVGLLTQIQVRDTGVGISAEVLPTIFDPYRQGDAPSRESFAGVGLGLFIVQRFVQALNGSIRVRSQVGRGSEFTVLLPDLVLEKGEA